MTETRESEVVRETEIFMTELLFVLPSDVDGAVLDEALDCVDDPSIMYVAADMPESVSLSADEAIAILAN